MTPKLQRQIDDIPVDEVKNVVIQHWYTKRKITVKLKKVDEDDCDFRFPEDNAELSYEWNVIEVK